MNIIYKGIDEIVPYENNPRNNGKAVKPVAESIKKFGFKVPVILDKNNVIIAGHTRVMAARLLDMEEVPCIMADDLTPEQVKAFRLADNKTAEIAEWDEEKLFEELKGITDFDMEKFGFDLDALNESMAEDEEKYSTKTNVPQYEITGECPAIGELYDMQKTNSLIEEIEKSGVSDGEKAFLIEAAKRHTVFNYRNCAEYYAHAEREMQELMEKSALVIIDIDNAIANGYVELTKNIEKIMENLQ